jgi:hypothetical protein
MTCLYSHSHCTHLRCLPISTLISISDLDLDLNTPSYAYTYKQYEQYEYEYEQYEYKYDTPGSSFRSGLDCHVAIMTCVSRSLVDLDFKPSQCVTWQKMTRAITWLVHVAPAAMFHKLQKTATLGHFWEKVPSLLHTRICTRIRICRQKNHPRIEKTNKNVNF